MFNCETVFIPGQARGETKVGAAHFFDVFTNTNLTIYPLMCFILLLSHCCLLSFLVSRIVEEARGQAHVDSCSPALSTENTLTVNIN